MRTTLSIDDDILMAARATAKQQHRGLDEVVSDLARRGLESRAAADSTRNGIRLLPPSQKSRPVTSEIVRQLCDGLT